MAGDVWNWVAGVFVRIGDVSIYWLVLALALKTAESALIGLTWRNILHAAYPGGGLSFKTAWGARHKAEPQSTPSHLPRLAPPR